MEDLVAREATAIMEVIIVATGAIPTAIMAYPVMEAQVKEHINHKIVQIWKIVLM